jgi:hypothetical protein
MLQLNYKFYVYSVNTMRRTLLYIILNSFDLMAKWLEHLRMGADSAPSLCLNPVATYVKDILWRRTKNTVTDITRVCKLTLYWIGEWHEFTFGARQNSSSVKLEKNTDLYLGCWFESTKGFKKHFFWIILLNKSKTWFQFCWHVYFTDSRHFVLVAQMYSAHVAGNFANYVLFWAIWIFYVITS